MIYFNSFWDGGIGESILDALRSLMLSLCEIVYKLIVFFFDIFMMLANAKLLENEVIQKIYQRVGLILGLFMIFRVTFSLIQYVINPDTMADKQKGVFNIVKRIFIVVILLGTTPSLFKFAYDIQEEVINSNVIPKIIIGKNVDSGDAGKTLAWYSFNAFYDYDMEILELDTSESLNEVTIRSKCPELNGDESLIQRDFMDNNSLKYAYNCVNEKVNYTVTSDDGSSSSAKAYVIDFTGHGFLTLVVGAVILWMILMYVIQVGVRVVQLSYLQLIAPVPIIMYLAPKGEDTFNKWVKQCITTYLDFFIRVAIIYFVVFIVELLIGNDSNHFVNSLGDPSGLDLTFITIIMILALLYFAQKLPKLFKELFPMSSGAAGFSFGLNPKKEVLEPLKAAYNSPLGWAPKALGWAGKKTIGAIDRKVHNLPKPRNKVQQYFDKIAPGHAEAVKYAEEKRKFDRSMANGKILYEQLENASIKFDENSTVADFTKFGFNADYANAYINSERATKNVNKISAALEEARINGDASKVGQLTTELAKAQSVQSKMKSALEYQEGQHRKDASRMADYKLYSSRTQKVDHWNNTSNYGSPLNNGTQFVQSQSATPSSAQNVTSDPSVQHNTTNSAIDNEKKINIDDIYVSESDIEDAYDKLYELTGSGASQEEINDQLNWINDITKENETNLEDAYSKLYELTGSGASQEEIDNQIKKINDIKSGEIKKD